MTVRNEVGVDAMATCLGHFVLTGKANVSSEMQPRATLNGPMAIPQAKSAFREQFARRVAWAREARGLTQAEMAELLGLDQGTYKQYESRTLLPHHLIAKFCLICGISYEWLFTAKGKAPAKLQAQSEGQKKRARRERAA